MVQEAGGQDPAARSAYGQSFPAPLIEWDQDRVEGETIEQLKWSAQEAFPEPLIDVPDDVKNNIAGDITKSRCT